MKYLNVIFFLVIISTYVSANAFIQVKRAKSDIYRMRGRYTYPQSEDDQKLLKLNAISEETYKLSEFIARVKKFIINGQYEKARFLLLNANYSKNFTKPIQFRYLAILNFIEGNYKKSLNLLNKKELATIQAQDKICALKTLNLLILENLQEAKFEWAKCKNITGGKSNTEHIWMSSLVSIKVNENENAISDIFDGLSIENEEEPFLSLFLKLSIYLNKQDLIIPRLKYLGLNAYENVKIRELIGMIYFRNGKLKKAYSLIEDLNTPNANNIRGNIYLAQKKYELAFAQFKLALKNKDNSQNALERIIPIAWLLKQWKEGGQFVRRLSRQKDSQFFQLALEAAFQTQAKNYVLASNMLEKIVKESRNSQSIEVNQLYAYNSLMLQDREKTDLYTNKSCAQKDGFSCWLRTYLLIWNNLTDVVDEDKKIMASNENLIEDYTSSFKENPIEEIEYISQKDIEELENAQIDLIPDTK